MTAEPVRIAVLGYGAIAQTVHAPILARMPGALLVAAADPSTTAREAAARLNPQIDVLDDFATLLRRDDVEAVIVCAPSALHGSLAVDVLEAGKHLYLEKPLAVDHEGGARAVAVASASARVSAIGFNRRFHPAYLRLRGLLAERAGGELREIRTRFCEPAARSLPEWKRRRDTGGGALLDLASHHIDLVRFLTREEVELQSASIRSIASEHDQADLVLRLGSGASVLIQVSFHGARADVVEVRCSRRTLTANRHGALRARVRPGWDPSYKAALRAFVDRLHDVDVELPTLEDGLRSLAVVLAAEAAAA